MLEETMIMMITGAKTVLEIKEWRPFIPKNKKKEQNSWHKQKKFFCFFPYHTVILVVFQ